MQENAIVHHLVWKLFHIEQGIENNTEAIQEKNDQLADMRATNSEADDQQKAAKKELNRATKDATRKEKEVKQREKDLDARVRARPGPVTESQLLTCDFLTET